MARSGNVNLNRAFGELESDNSGLPEGRFAFRVLRFAFRVLLTFQMIRMDADNDGLDMGVRQVEGTFRVVRFAFSSAGFGCDSERETHNAKR